MINKIVHKKKILAIVIKKYRSKKGITFFTNPKDTQQIGYMKHKKNHIIQPHTHKKKIKKNNEYYRSPYYFKRCFKG